MGNSLTLCLPAGNQPCALTLVELIQHAEELGQVTGLITDGCAWQKKSTSPAYSMLTSTPTPRSSGAGRTFLGVYQGCGQCRHPSDSAFHDKLHNFSRISEIFARLYGLGVNHISISASNKEFSPYLAEAGRKAAEVGFRLVYDLPVPYSKLNPVSLELEGDVTAVEGQGRSWLYVEPDGDVAGAGHLAQSG